MPGKNGTIELRGKRINKFFLATHIKRQTQSKKYNWEKLLGEKELMHPEVVNSVLQKKVNPRKNTRPRVLIGDPRQCRFM
jgi:hypothetical protein